MIQVLIADDEAMTREILRDYIPWHDLGANNILEAEDGMHAYSLAIDNKPDLILVDIRMPGMNGIELIDKLKEHLPYSRFIIISGYAEKEYLKSAIRLNVTEFIDKPLQLETLIATFRRVITEIIHDQSSRDLKENYLINRVIRQLCNGTFDSSSILYDLKSLGVNFNDNQPYRCVLTKSIFIKQGDEDISLLFDKLVSQYRFRLTDKRINSIISRMDDRLILLYEATTKQDDIRIVEFLNELFDEIESISSGKISALSTVGLKVPGLFQIKHSYTNELQALGQSFVAGRRSIIAFSPSLSGLSQLNTDRLNEFRDMIIHGERINSSLWRKSLTDEMRSIKGVSAGEARYRLLKVLTLMNDTIQDLNISVDDLNIPERMNETATTPTLDQVEFIINSTLEQIMDRVAAKHSSNPVSLRVMKLIKENVASPDLSISLLSDRLFLSPAHLCTVFKQETGKTISHAITEYRMEEARRLLLSSNMNNCELASRVGYQDSKYFSKVFERYYGMKPRKLKAQQT